MLRVITKSRGEGEYKKFWNTKRQAGKEKREQNNMINYHKNIVIEINLK